MELSFTDMLFDLIGRLCFRRQQAWLRRRNAKILTAAVIFGLVLGLLLIWLIRHMNSIQK